ncbi:MAG: insulinase family protein [Planctomycetes bacterium]|nr:insulinase family protein [Planctomycetota bacterium]
MTTPTPATGLASADYKILQDRPDRLIVQLPNRLIVIAQEFRAAPVVSAQVWVKTGSIYEQEHVGAGLSHFLEHLLAGGTTGTRTEEESNRILGRIGARTNASTGLDTVRYYIDTTSAHTMTAVDLLSDWMQHSLISDTEYKRERDVIQREFDMGQGDPSRIFWKVTQSMRYREHPARHPTIGYLDEFLAISRDEIYSFYKRMYVPNNMVFVVVGDIDRRAVVDRVAAQWRDAKAGELPVIALPVEKPQDGGPRLGAGTADIRRPRLRLAWPGTKLGAESDYALDLLGVLMGQGESSRLVRAVRDEARLVSTISAYNLSYPWGEGFFGIDAEVAVPPVTQGKTARGVAEEASESAKQAILKEVARLRTDGITEEELARAKRQTLARVVFEGQEVNEIAERLASDTIGMSDPDYRVRYAAAIQRLTVGDVTAAAARFLDDQHMMLLVLNPLEPGKKPETMTRPKDPPITDPAPREQFSLDNLSLASRMSDALRAAGEKSVPLTIAQTQRFVMSNGLRLIVQRSTIAPAVSIQLYRLGGLLADEQGKEGVSGAVSAMLLKGTATRTAEQIASLTDNLGVAIAAECGNNTSYVRAQCLREDWKTTLGLIADVTIHPTFPDDQWEKVRPRLLAAIAREQDSWNGELRARFREAYFGDYPWSRSPLGRASVVEALTAEKLREFHRLRLGASQAVLAVFGDVDADEVRREVEKAFEDMPKEPLSPVQISDPVPPAAKVVQAETKKPMAAVMIGLGPGVTRRSPDYAALQVWSRVISSFPSGWLDEELRGRGPGLVYAVGAGQVAGLVPGYFSVMFNSKATSAPEAVARSMRVVERAKTAVLDDETLARAKAGVLTDEFGSQQSDNDRAAGAALIEMYGMDIDEPTRFLRAVDQLTPEAMRNIAQLYMRSPVVVVLSHQPIDGAILKDAVEGKAAGNEPPATQPSGE